LFASILIYSFANIANAFVTTPELYAVCRFLGGLGLAGELGAAITLVAESLPQEKRGLGTTVVATLGMFGILAASLIGQKLPWKIAYGLGGIMGLGLLFMRFKVSESSLFTQATHDKDHNKPSSLNRGNLLLILQKKRFSKYIACIVIGIPIYFTTGILFSFAPELTAGLHVKGAVSAGNTILFGSIGLALGDMLSGLLSQKLRSRRKSVALSLLSGFCFMLIYIKGTGLTAELIYALSFALGLSVGYWAVLITMAAEQFGTNIRGTVSTTVPNFVRGSAALATTAFAALKGHFTVASSALIVGSVCFGLAFLALFVIDETFSRDLDYDEYL
jgi:MFS family permease